MPIVDRTINKHIDAELIRLNDERDAAHTASGKLSASMLYQPVRFQVLKTLGAPSKAFDAYTLAKFKRGNDVEAWYVTQLRGAKVLLEDAKEIEKLNLIWDGKAKQPKAMYKECIGYVDSIINTDFMDSKKGIIPNEIKSVTNMKMRRIKATGIDWHYKIQAALYAMAMKTEYFAVTIVSAEDFRSEMHLFTTRSLAKDVDLAISAYDEAMKAWKENQVLPAFEANPQVPWTKNIKYAMFSEEWVTDDKWAMKELTKLGLM